jgi:hypothetical protein
MRTQVRATATDYADATALRSTVTYGPSNRNLPAPGPFSAERTKNGESMIGGALMTGLLVMYPVVAIIAVILMGFALPAVAG